MTDVLQISVWLLTMTLMLVGLIGVVVPILPGTTLILIAAMVHKWMRPEDLSWLAIGFVAIFWVFSIVVDFVGVLIGTKWFGGGKWGMAGASGGALVGMLFSLRLLVLGTILGAIAAERLVAKRTNTEALKAGVGAAFGFVISTIARLVCACVMIALFIAAVAWPRSVS